MAKLQNYMIAALMASIAATGGCYYDPEDESDIQQTTGTNASTSVVSDTSTVGQTTATNSATDLSTSSTTADTDTAQTLSDSSSATTTTTDENCKRYDASTIAGCPQILGESFCQEPAIHISSDTVPVWGQNPPNSGMHDGSWASWGVKDVPTPRRNWVHNLEHGGVVFVYRCPSGCPIELDILSQVVAQRPELRIIVTEDPELPWEGVAAVSWTWSWAPQQLTLAEALCFADQHEGHAPEDIK